MKQNTKRAVPRKTRRRAVAGTSSVAQERRILILAPTGNDASLTAEFLTKAGLGPQICRDVDELCAQVRLGCGAILLAEETLGTSSISMLVEALAQQPAWSDIPVTIITSGGEASQMQLRRLAIFGPGGNVTLLERPLRPGTLISTQEVALRARQRQYEARNLVQALRESGERLNNFYESSHDCIKELDLKGRILSMNQHGMEMLGGGGFENFRLKSWLSFWQGQNRQQAGQVLQAAQMGKVARFQGSCRTIDKVLKWWDVIVSPIFDSAGKPERILAVSRDITETKQQQEALTLLTRRIEEQARVFDTTLSYINDFAYIFDRNGRFLYANKPLLDLFGLKLEEAVGKDFWDLHYSPELAERLQRQIKHVFDTKQAVRDETPYISPTGKVGYYEYIFNPVEGLDGRVEIVAGSTRDVTERKLNEAKLAVLVAEKEAQSRLFDATLSSITDLAYTFDLEGNWIYANKPLLRLWGKSLAEITGKSSLELGYPPELAARLKRQVKQVVATRQPFRGETYFTDAAGVEDYHEYIFSPVFAADGTVSAVCGTTRLTTARKRAEAVAESQRLVLQLMAEDMPLAQVLDALMHTAELECATKMFASVMLLDRDGVHLRHGAAPGLPAEFMRAIDGLAVGPMTGSCGAAVFFKAPVYTHDIATDERWTQAKETALAHGLRACWSFPIFSTRREVLGTFAMYLPEAREVKENDLRLVEMVTRTAAIAIERKLSDRAIRENQQRYTQLVQSLPTAVYTTDAQGRITLYNEAAAVLWGEEPEAGKDFWCESCRIYQPDGRPLPLDQSPMAMTLKEGRPVRGEEIIIERADGARFNVLPYPDPILDVTGQVVGAVNMLLDITESKRAEEASRRLAAIVESSDDAIISKDLNGVIISWNGGAARLFGYEAHEIIGKPVTVLMSSDQVDEEPKILQRIRTGKSIEHCETTRRRKDGSMVEISLTISPVRDSKGKIIGASKIIRDITEQKLAERKLEQAHREAVAASRAKDEFLAALSHELRTPLNPVLLLASEAAENPDLPAEVRAQFTTVRNNVELEARLIDDLLDITRITHGKLSLNLDSVEVSVVLKEAIETVRADLDQKQIRLMEHLRAKRTGLRGDAVRLQQVFWNVLKNAVKFTPPGGVITVDTHIHQGKLVVAITDTGIGMTDSELVQIFEAFTQGDHVVAGGSHRFGGLGLGLAISRKLVELHAGTIKASSQGRGQGSTFTITLPLAPVNEQPKHNGIDDSASQPKTAGNQNKTLHILLVEDHEATRTALALLLKRRSYQAKTAGSLAEARELAANERFQVLISDIGLPDGNGFELMRELKASNEDLQGIALTGYGMEEDITKGQSVGFKVHLTKPVRVQSLEAALATITAGLDKS